MKIYYHAIKPENMEDKQGQQWFFRRNDLAAYVDKLFNEAVSS